MHRESKCELTDRLRREGRWEAFKKRREELKAAGTDAADAWIVAADEFPPEDTPPATESLIPWSKARRRVNAAKTDLEWLLLAYNVQIPAKVAAQRPDLYGILQELRTNRTLRNEFHKMLLNRLLEHSKAFRERPTITLDELLAKKRLDGTCR